MEPPTPEAWETIAAPLREIRDRWLATPQRFELSPEAKDLWSEFYIDWRTARKEWDQNAANLSARTFEHVLKIALVYSVLSNQEEIDVKSLAIAIAIGEWLEKTRLRLFGTVGLDHFSKAETVILERLRQREGWEYIRDLQQWASKRRINGKMFREVLRTLEDNCHVKTKEKSTMANRIRPYVEMV